MRSLARLLFCTFCIYAKINVMIVTMLIILLWNSVFFCRFLVTAIIACTQKRVQTRTRLSCQRNHVRDFLLAAYANAANTVREPYLEILPNGETQTKPIGSSIILTCKPKVDNPLLISQMQWLDPQNRVIESLK